MWRNAIVELRKFNDWLAYGALGPTLLLVGGLSVDIGFRKLGPYDYLSGGKLTAMACIATGVIIGALGVLFTLRPRVRWWLAVLGLVPMTLANVVLSYMLYFPRDVSNWLVSSLEWLAIASLLAFYTYHCHRPVFGWAAPTDLSEELPPTVSGAHTARL